MLSIYLRLLDSVEEQNKFEALYNLHKRTMLYKAREILKDDHLAEDAVHDAFLRVIKNFTKIGEIDCPRTRAFLVIIVRNVSFSMLEKSKREVSFDDAVDFTRDSAFVEAEILDRIECEAIIATLEKLPVQYRDILYLQYVEEYKLTQIAALFDLNQEVVKKRAQRGRKKLIDLLNARSVLNGKSKTGIGNGVLE